MFSENQKFSNSIEGEITLLSIGMFLTLGILLVSSALLNSISTNRENFEASETTETCNQSKYVFQKNKLERERI